jgi:hypothetical protein
MDFRGDRLDRDGFNVFMRISRAATGTGPAARRAHRVTASFGREAVGRA